MMPPSKLKEWVFSVEPPYVLLMDGGVSTHLEHLIHPQVFEHRSLWSSSLLLTEFGQNAIRKGHEDWLAAGSDIITTVTYQCHFGTAGKDLDAVSLGEMTTMMETGVRLAQDAVRLAVASRTAAAAASERLLPFVVVSSGCYGGALADGSEYTGNYPNINRDGLVEFHNKKASGFLDQAPDGLAIETVPSVEECAAACLALQSISGPYAGTACCWISLACKDGETLNEGVPLFDALQTIRDFDPEAKYVHAIGVNCCDSAHISSLLQKITRHMATHGPKRGIVVYPNSGEEWDASNETWKEGTGCKEADVFADRLMDSIRVVSKTWNENNGNGPMPKMIVGGCCRTSPETIASLRTKIDQWHESRKEM